MAPSPRSLLDQNLYAQVVPTDRPSVRNIHSFYAEQASTVAPCARKGWR